MSSPLLIATLTVQVGFALFVLAAIGERIRHLCSRAATSDDALRWVTSRLEAGDQLAALAWAAQRPQSHVARVLQAALASDATVPEPSDDLARERALLLARDAETRECLLDLREEASARLRMLRVCATLASTLGLLGGILALAGSSHMSTTGVSRDGLSHAISVMAIGVATSALCFQGLALLRPAAQKLLSQSAQVARTAQLRSQPMSGHSPC